MEKYTMTKEFLHPEIPGITSSIIFLRSNFEIKLFCMTSLFAVEHAYAQTFFLHTIVPMFFYFLVLAHVTIKTIIINEHFFHVVLQCFRNSLRNISEFNWINSLVFLPKTAESDFLKGNRLELN